MCASMFVLLSVRRDTWYQVSVPQRLEGGGTLSCHLPCVPCDLKTSNVEQTGLGAWNIKFLPYWTVAQRLLKPWRAEVGSPSSPKDHTVLPGARIPAKVLFPADLFGSE